MLVGDVSYVYIELRNTDGPGTHYQNGFVLMGYVISTQRV